MILDKRRNFSNKTKAALILKANNKCQFCKKPIKNINDIEFNHNHPHALGGLSNVNNGDVFHKSCNRNYQHIYFPMYVCLKIMHLIQSMVFQREYKLVLLVTQVMITFWY